MKEFVYMKVGGHSHNTSNGVIDWKILLRLSFDQFIFAVVIGFTLFFLTDLKYMFQRISILYVLYAFQ